MISAIQPTRRIIKLCISQDEQVKMYRAATLRATRQTGVLWELCGDDLTLAQRITKQANKLFRDMIQAKIKAVGFDEDHRMIPGTDNKGGIWYMQDFYERVG